MKVSLINMNANLTQIGALLRTYDVKYIFDSPVLPKSTVQAKFQLYNNGFLISGKSVPQTWIPYNQVYDFKITDEVINLWTHSYNNLVNKRIIQLEYSDNANQNCIIKLQMPTGKTIVNSLKGYRSCEELKIFMHSAGIFDRFLPKTQCVLQNDIPIQIEKLSQLHKSGALTDEEFQSKKAELLKRL